MAAKAWVMAAMLAGVPIGVARADEPSTSNKEAGLHEARGAVHQVDKETNRVIVEQQKGSPLTLQVDRTTTIFIDGRTGSLDEIKAGADVRASYESKQGSNKAQWIEVTKSRKKPSLAKEKPAEAPTKEPPSPPPAPAITH